MDGNDSKSKPISLLVGTKKGGFIITKSDSDQWLVSDPIQLGNLAYHMVQDPRDPEIILMACRTGHLGPTIFRSQDSGNSWTETSKPPAFPKSGDKNNILKRVFYLAPGHSSEDGVWYAGTTPHGLFRSEDGGNTWDGVSGFNDNPDVKKWTEGTGSPIGQLTHSINIDPRDKNHIYLGLSGGGFFESTDRGGSWVPLNKGSHACFLPEPDVEYGQDVHNAQLHPKNPDRLYQQNHCGIYKMDRNEGIWHKIGDNMPKNIGDVGFPLVLHPYDIDTFWVFPMDSTDVWPRTCKDGKPAVYKTMDAGETFIRQENGFPEKNAWFTVYRQAMTADTKNPIGLYLGTTSGEIWTSENEGDSWKMITQHLPDIYSLEIAVDLS